MKLINNIRRIIVFLLVVFVALIINVNGDVFADTDNFYFGDFTADYYLTRDEQGISHLKVVENFTAVFPDFNQNKGMCREIPFTNMDGANVTLPSLSRADIKLTRNGSYEPIYSIDKKKDFYRVCTGDETYVTGKQVYTLEYEFERVVTEFDNYQELYWDTNGNGWFQKFNSLTARVHFGDELVKKAYDGNKWCYVGSYGQSGQSRCTITELPDGLQFTTNNLSRYENLTFDIQFNKGAFVVPAPEKSYVLLVILAGIVLFWSLMIAVFPLRKYLKVNDKRKHYKGRFISPEYQPSKDFSLAEMAENYIGKKEDYKVALLLDMAIKKKITLKKVEKNGIISHKNGWKIVLNDVEGLSEQEGLLLDILNGGTTPVVGEEIEVKTRTATSKLASLGKKIGQSTVTELKRDGLVDGGYNVGGSYPPSTFANIFTGFIGGGTLWVVSAYYYYDIIISNTRGIIVGKEYYFIVGALISMVAVALWSWMNGDSKVYANHKIKGLDMSRYMDGLKLYIGMAEADRMKMLQSVEGADTSPEGIVKLYEKLLPYAAIFGLEDTWMEEMEQYCKTVEYEPDYNLSMYDMMSASRLMASTVRSSSSISSSGTVISGGGGSSSGFSGGGGGGFSGGGGGGGGGGGR